MKQETTIVPDGIYQHYKGNYYQVIDIARHSETLEQLVVYRALYGTFELWVRPASLFSESIMINNLITPRFTYTPQNIPSK